MSRDAPRMQGHRSGVDEMRREGGLPQRDGESGTDCGGDEIPEAALIDSHAVADGLQPIRRAVVSRGDSIPVAPRAGPRLLDRGVVAEWSASVDPAVDHWRVRRDAAIGKPYSLLVRISRINGHLPTVNPSSSTWRREQTVPLRLPVWQAWASGSSVRSPRPLPGLGRCRLQADSGASLSPRTSGGKAPRDRPSPPVEPDPADLPP
jgi:hypothetical protein